ncbi:Thiamine biosynthesis lipoprotein ApbE precursor [Caulifigura coniformis]|uniref:FAD:protein FMN transferase n=1 Tax=Caulifigura coniformis TaxID=2527983 RepID=A0A517SCB0_9PLAN|nr:FAD:protein FMN transferase [Caulifigura coniformis]QDT53745.1 Thiamine biosynthesis lipoprotein ApbE precursor [Caulifigura coniformis]
MSTPSPSRRDFLSGRSARRVVEAAGDVIADRITEEKRVPMAGDTIRLETQAMACPWNVIMNPGPPDQVMKASDAFEVVHDVESQLTVYRAESEISQVNFHAAEGPVEVSQELFDFLDRARKLSLETNGAFDPATGALLRTWRAARREGRIPTQSEIDEALLSTGVAKIEFDAGARTIRFPRAGFAFDLGAIGKGHGVDRAAESLRGAGLTDFLVHGGFSSVYGAGDHLGQGGWPVALKNPLFLEGSYATVLLNDAGLGTSGSNVQYFRHEGRRFGHILDPRTGWPAEGLLSVTVLAASTADADAISTALFVMGREAAIEWCQAHPEVGALLVPPPSSSGELLPVVCNLPRDLVFLAEDVASEDA